MTTLNLVFTICFAVAIAHTFMAGRIHGAGTRARAGSLSQKTLSVLGELELVFALWAAVALALASVIEGGQVWDYLKTLNFTEPVFVFVILVVAATRPVLELAESAIRLVSRALGSLFKLSSASAFLLSALTVGPLLGSFITEPAAMTVTALLLKQSLFSSSVSPRLRYSILGALFVNVSVGGVLTPFAAPPVLMVAGAWGWGLPHMLQNFGWKGALATVISAVWILWLNRKELSETRLTARSSGIDVAPSWLTALHVALLLLVVVFAHHVLWFLGVFAAFALLVRATNKSQSPLRTKEGALVAVFLAGLVVLGGQQRWWLQPVLSQLSSLQLYASAIGLTALIDNAAITYLGAQVGLVDPLRYFIVAGSVVGGGLTVIANAPNPIGYGLLAPSFGDKGIEGLKLFAAALVPTLIAAVLFLIH